MNYYHIIDHLGWGSIHNVISPLCSSFGNHFLVVPKNRSEYIDYRTVSIINSMQCVVVIHSSGQCMDNNYLTTASSLFPKKTIFCFLHTSAMYQIEKKRENVFSLLKDLQKNNRCIILSPSQEVTQQYLDLGLWAKSVQLGIPSLSSLMPTIELYNPALSMYYGKIITTCGSEKEIYKYVKGIDRYKDLLINLGIAEMGLIAGCESSTDTRFLCKRFSEIDFLNILFHSIIYVQLSRLESYNVTAIQAKQLRIPVAVLACEGTTSCMREHVCTDIDQIKAHVLSACANNYDEKEISDNYQDSIKRESLDSFKISIEEACEYDSIS